MALNPLDLEEKRGPGRPRKPEAPTPQDLLTREQTIRDLKNQVQILEKAIKTSQDPYNELKDLAEIIRIVQRAVKGLGADEDVFAGLINIKDIRERTRLDEAALLSHSAMRVVSESWPELDLFLHIAEMEDPYFISEDGEGRKEGILLQQAKTGTDRANLVLNMPNTAGGPAQDPSNPAGPPKKKSIIDKVLRR